MTDEAREASAEHKPTIVDPFSSDRSTVRAEFTRKLANKIANMFQMHRRSRLIEEPQIGVYDLTNEIEEGPDGQLRFRPTKFGAEKSLNATAMACKAWAR